MMPLIDTHAHIYLEEFDTDRTEMIDRARSAGVEHLVMPNIDSSSIERMLVVEAAYPSFCYAAMGLHPCSVKEDVDSQLQEVEHWLSRRHFVAIGEIGTDLYWDKTYWDQQQEAFLVQLQWAKKYNLPVIIHCRESLDETIKLVQRELDENLTGVFHCFSGNALQAQQIIEMGFSLGIGGVATFKNGGLDKVLPQVNLEDLVLETDSPYLAPVPHRGKRNEPVYVRLVANRVAELLNTDIDTISKVTTENARRLFDI